MDAGDAEENEEGSFRSDAEEQEEGSYILAADASEIHMEKEAEYRMGVVEKPSDVPHWQRWPRKFSSHWIHPISERIAKEGLELGRKMVEKADGEVEGCHWLTITRPSLKT